MQSEPYRRKTIQKQKLMTVLNRIRDEYAESIAKAIKECPHLTYDQIAKQEGVSRAHVILTARLRGLTRTPSTTEVTDETL